jgi:SulP family sulfate permease
MALFTGLILLTAACLRFGATADLLSTPVMQGFLNGAAAVIVINQLDRLCGLQLHRENSLGRLLEWAGRLGESQLLPLSVGLGCVLALALIRRLLPNAPAIVLLFAAALTAGALFDLPALGLTVLGPLDTWLPPLNLTLAGGELTRLFTASIGLAVLIFPESIVLGRAVAEQQGYKVDPDRELVALGAANVTAGLLRGFAVGASQTRTLLNVTSGGRTQAVSVIAAGCILAFLFFLSPLLASLPTIVLSAILLHTGLMLMDLRVYRRLWTLDRFSASVSALTTLGVIAVGVLPGILLGVGASLLRVLSQIARPQDALLGRVKGSVTLHDVGDDEAAETIPGLVAYRFYGPLVFANVRFFIERIEHFLAKEETPVRELIIDARAIPEIDLTAAEQIKAFFSRLRERGIEVVIAKAHLPLRQAATLLGLGETFAQTRLFAELADAVADYERRHLADRQR